MRRVVVLDVVGLTPRMLERAPGLEALAREGFAAPMDPVVPAVTSTVQASLLTGLPPSGHGVVANGWYFRELAEVLFWRQSNRLVAGEKVWEAGRARDPSFTCAKVFWWFNMHSTADFSVTVRPAYPADGRKIPDIYTQPAGLREEVTGRLGPFPLFQFWGPGAGIVSSRWIAACAKLVFDRHLPTLTLVYLPHLDYDLQRFGPEDRRVGAALAAIDGVAADLARHVRDRAEVVVLSEYGIRPVSGPVHVNRVLRDAGFLAVHVQLGKEYLDPGASRAFAVSDHQVAHVYVRDPRDVAAVAELLRGTPGVGEVLGEDGKEAHRLDHPRSGELVLFAAPDRWFTYYYWKEDGLAPDFARTVDIHRKPGYDPVELHVDPALAFPRLRIARRLAQKALGFRYLMDVISLDASIVKGSHGLRPTEPLDGPVFLSTSKKIRSDRVDAIDVKDLLLELVFS
ncbi:MAG: alkaline phosphatase family protein [Planctomycetes bacterium]|nr:alkaline phosphatase family protein [Planctomycetota bacterium]